MRGMCFPTLPIARAERRRNYLNLIEPAAYSIQVGDLGFDYSGLSSVDATFHRVILYSFWVSPSTNGRSNGHLAAGGPGYPKLVDTVGKAGLQEAGNP